MQSDCNRFHFLIFVASVDSTSSDLGTLTVKPSISDKSGLDFTTFRVSIPTLSGQFAPGLTLRCHWYATNQE